MIKKIAYNIFLIILALGVFSGVLILESKYSVIEAKKRSNIISLTGGKGLSVSLSRNNEEISFYYGNKLEKGDIVINQDRQMVEIAFSTDGRIRLGVNTKLLVKYVDEMSADYVFELLEGEVWINNLFTGANINLNVNGGLIYPQKTIFYAKTDGESTLVYSHSGNSYLIFSTQDQKGEMILTDRSENIINYLFLPQGTQATIFANKITENPQIISRLYYSKLIKEFAYSVFDKNLLRRDIWFSSNTQNDQLLALEVKNERLKKIRNRGIKYSDLDASNYFIDQFTKDFYNFLTFSKHRTGKRDMMIALDFLYDTQYLYDVGRVLDAKNRFNLFKRMVDRLYDEFVDELKEEFNQAIFLELDYLEFVSPEDSLFSFKTDLYEFYLKIVKGSERELSVRYRQLLSTLANIGYYAEIDNFSMVNSTYDYYAAKFDELFVAFKKELEIDPRFVQHQNQILDYLFGQYSQLYRKNFFLNKLRIETAYLSLLKTGESKNEEIQTIIAQRIDFLRKLRAFFLDEKVLLNDAQSILVLLITEIDKIKLPVEYQLAVNNLFNERLRDYGLFHRFLNSPAYVTSPQKGRNYNARYEAFVKEHVITESIDQIRSEILREGTLTKGEDDFSLTDNESNQNIVILDIVELPTFVPEENIIDERLEEMDEFEEDFEISFPNEEEVIIDINGEISTVVNEVDVPRTPRVKR